MRKKVDISEKQLDEFLNQFYDYFTDGYAFEEFLKFYLERIGLDEVMVTQRSSDGGIDLKAIRYGVGDLDGSDAIYYYVQAKRNKPGTTIAIEKVRALRGVMPSGSKGLFITTADFSKRTIEFLENDLTRPIVLINGKKLVESCIDNEIGFVFNPIFSKAAMDELKDSSTNTRTVESENVEVPIIVVEKQISANDIRAKILRLPKAIADIVGNDVQSVVVIFHGLPEKQLRIDKTRSYLAGVTELYKKTGLISEDGAFNPGKTVWKYYADRIEVILKNDYSD